MSEAAAGCRRRSPDGRSFAQAELRKVRTPQGNAPHESEGREPRGTRTDSAAERYRRWSARTQARVKWWSKSPPRIRVTGRHGKPRVVQDRTGKGLPVRSFPGISRTLRKQGAPLRRGERNGRPASQEVDRIRLTGERQLLLPAGLTWPIAAVQHAIPLSEMHQTPRIPCRASPQNRLPEATLNQGTPPTPRPSIASRHAPCVPIRELTLPKKSVIQ